MNFTDLVSYVTTKTQLVTTDDIAACKLFISKRYELLWNSNLWKDALIMVQVPFDPVNNLDNKDGIVLLPEVVNRVVGLRTQTQSVKINGLEYFYRIDWDAFNAGTTNVYGAAAEFAIISPVWFIWRGTDALKLQYADDLADTAPCMVTWRDETGKQYVQQLNNGALLTSTNIGSNLLAGATYDSGGSFALTLTIGATYVYTLGAGESFRNGGGTPPSPFIANSTSGNFSGNPNAPIKTTLQLCSAARIEVESMFKKVTNFPISLNPIIGTVAGGTLQTTDTASPSYQRIRLFSIPTDTMTLNVLGKRPFVPLTFDQQIPQLRNIDNVLIAFTCADMLKRARQYAKAAQELTEGVSLLKELASLEVLQAANHQQFIPSSGMGDAYFSPSNCGGWGGYGY